MRWNAELGASAHLSFFLSYFSQTAYVALLGGDAVAIGNMRVPTHTYVSTNEFLLGHMDYTCQSSGGSIPGVIYRGLGEQRAIFIHCVANWALEL